MVKPVELIDIGGKKVSKTSTGKRKFHNKSKLGCDNCKRRRVKCDETKPGCKKCQNMGLTCVYSPPQPRKKRKRIVKTPSTTDNTSAPETKPLCNPTGIKSETQLHQPILDSNHTIPTTTTTTTTAAAVANTTIPATATLHLQKEINNLSDPSVVDYMKKLQQLQFLQQQQAILLSQINSSMMNKKENTPELQNLPKTTITNNNNNNFNIPSVQEGILLPPLIANSPVMPNLEMHITSSIDKMSSNPTNMNSNNNIWSNTSLSLTPKTSDQSLGISMPGGLNNSFSPNKFSSNSMNTLTPSTNNIYKSLNSLPNVLSVTSSSNNGNNNNSNNLNNHTMPLNNINIVPGYEQNYFNAELQNLANSKNINNISSTLMSFFNGNNNVLLNGNVDLLTFGKNNNRPNNNNNNRSLKANNAEVALANMQQQQEEQHQITSRNNENNTNKESHNSKISPNLEENRINPIKNMLDETALSNVSDPSIEKNNIPSSVNTNNKNDNINSNLRDSQIDYSISNSSSTHSINGNELQITESNSPMNSSCGEQSPSSLNTISKLIELSTIAKLNLVDIKLFHHYCTIVWKTITAAGISGPEVWETYIPNLAFDYPFLMHTILAFSASHLSRTETGLEQYVSSHRLEALKLLREAVLEISEENTDALVASSLILIMDSLANASNTTTSSDSNTSAWIFHVKGAVTILTAVWPLAESSKFYNLISVNLSDLSDVLSQENRTISELVCFDESISDLYPVEIDSPYLITLAYLDQLHREKNQLDFLLRVFAFPALLDRTFLALLMTGDIDAMRIMRSYYKMLHGFTTEVKDRVWFLEGVSQVLPQDVDEYSGGGGMHMMLDFLGGGLPSMTTTNLSEFM